MFPNYTKRLLQINVKHKTTLFYRFYFVSCPKKPLLSTKRVSVFPENDEAIAIHTYS